MPELSETAPAQPASADPSSPLSAVDAAFASGDQAALRVARQAERAGKPLPDVTPASADPAAAPESKPPSKRQQHTNDAIREAVDRATADLRAEVERLRAGAHPEPASPAAPAPTTGTPEWKRYHQMPDAPKLADFDSVEEHTAAMALFIADKRLAERDQAAQRDRSQTERTQALREHAQTFTTRVRADVEAMPGAPKRDAFASDVEHAQAMHEFAAATFPPAVLKAHPLSDCPVDPARGPIDPDTRQPVTFANLVAEAAFRSEHPAALLAYLHAHQDETVAIANLGSFPEAMAALMRLDGRVSGTATKPSAPTAPPPKTLTDAPAPPVTLGSRPTEPSDPIEAAVRSGDQAALKAAKQRQRAAALGR